MKNTCAKQTNIYAHDSRFTVSCYGWVLGPRLGWISNYIHYKGWDEITYPFPNFNGTTVEVWEWITNFIPHFTEHVIIYPW